MSPTVMLRVVAPSSIIRSQRMPPLFAKATTVFMSFVASSIRPVSQLPAMVFVLLPIFARRVMLRSTVPSTSSI